MAEQTTAWACSCHLVGGWYPVGGRYHWISNGTGANCSGPAAPREMPR